MRGAGYPKPTSRKKDHVMPNLIQHPLNNIFILWILNQVQNDSFTRGVGFKNSTPRK